MTTIAELELPDRYIDTGDVREGGFGKIDIYIDSYLDRLVAIKSMKPGGDQEELKSEVSAYRDINSKHVAEIYDLVKFSDDSHALIEEYVPGQDLLEWSVSDVTLDSYLKTLYQISCGITDIHATNIIHRDIKPNNMRFDFEGIIKIFDFGFSCTNDDLLETATRRGTHAYRAPEFYAGAPAKFNNKVDIYAFGVSAWVLATRTFPDSLIEIPPQSKTLPPSFSTLILGLPDEVATILDRCISIDPTKRPEIIEVRDAISRRLVFGKHRGILHSKYKHFEISRSNPQVKLKAGVTGSILVNYDGLVFTVVEIVGDVFCNNIPLEQDTVLPDASVITIGAPELQASRTFISFNISRPEVVL